MNSPDELLRHAEQAWLTGDLRASTQALTARAGGPPGFVKEASLADGALPAGLRAEPLTLGGQTLSSSLVTFERGIAVFDIGVPLLDDGTFYSQAFAHLKYPERYAHLFGPNAGAALKTAAANPQHVSDAYVTLVRPPYYHWLLDTVPHLYGAARLGRLDQVKLIAPDSMPLRPWQKALLEKATGAFGIRNLAYVPVDGSVVGVRPGYSQTRMALADRLTLLRLLAPPVSKKPWRVLYSRRGRDDVRRLLNEEAVLNALSSRVTVIEAGSLSLDEQMTLFAEARCIIGVHGSNLANIAFCQRGTAVIEIAAGLTQPHFETLANAAGLIFRRVDATPQESPSDPATSGNPTWAQAHGDLTADPAAVVGVVEEALAGTGT